MIRKVSASSSQKGVTIIEMLVALVVLGVGMLGVASLFAVSLRAGSSAIQRTHAVSLASNMADRIRANRRAGDTYTTTTVAATDNKCVGASAVDCTADEMAKNDIYLWKQEIARAFPGGTATGTIAYTAGAGVEDPATYKITIQWKEQGRNSTETSLAQSYVLEINVPEN